MPRSRSRKRSTKRRRWILLSVVLVLLIGGAGGAYYVFKVAKQRSNPYKQVQAALEKGDTEGAEAQARSILEANPKDDRSRLLLVAILMDSNRLDEAESFIEYWKTAEDREVVYVRESSKLALRRGDLGGAVKLARSIADREPAFVQTTLIQVYDLMGTPQSRERSARAAETLATIASAPEMRAEAWLHAAETLRQISGSAPNEAAKAMLRRRSDVDRESARQALRESRAWTERYPEGKALMARIDLLTSDEDKQKKAVEELREFLAEKPEAYRERMSLTRHLIRRGEYGRAAESIRALAEAPALLYLRALSAMAAAGERELVLQLIDEYEGPAERMQALIRARVLLAGEGEEREQGIAAIEKLALESPDDRRLVLEAYQRIRATGDLERALAVLEKADLGDAGFEFGILLERAVAAVASGDAASQDALLTKVAEQAQGADLLAALRRIRTAEGEGEAAAMALLDKALASGKADASGVRMLRAFLLLAKAGEDAKERKARALEDLTVIGNDDGASRAMLTNATKLAIRAGEAKLAGRLLGRALTAPGEPADELGAFLQACNSKSAEAREEAAEGMRGTPDEDHRAWLGLVADALAAGDASTLRTKYAKWKPKNGAPQPLEARLQFALAARDRDFEEGEAYARAIRKEWPELPGGTLRVGSMLLAGRKYEQFLEELQGEDLDPLVRLQRVEALHALKRTDEAIAEARQLAVDTDGDDPALFALGQLLKKEQPMAALAALASISATANPQLRAEAEFLRAEILEGQERWASAGQIYETLLLASSGRNLKAWRGYSRVTIKMNGAARLVLRFSKALESPPAGMSTEAIAELVLMRAQAREHIEDYQKALEDYRRVLAVVPNHLMALNNAAWIIANHIPWAASERPERLKEALDMATQALEGAPGQTAVLHTRAKIYEAAGRPEDALRDLDAAIHQLTLRLDPEGPLANDADAVSATRSRRASFLLDKAAILKDMGKRADARAIYESVRDEAPDSSEGVKAKIVLQAWDE